MARITQADIAHHVGVSAMTIYRATLTVGRGEEVLGDDVALCLLVASELRDLGIAWPTAVQLVARFRDEVSFLSFDPALRRSWIVSVERADGSRFQMTAVSERHLASIIDSRCRADVLALHGPVARAVEELDALKARKAAA
ncbi:hypothetical protein [Ancylobacter sp. SL191]|uniref:hypothetical protein n=1 Tax=Ancylobacter sp. SL191 TaxID=2995166 RepID=UPI00227212D1|nr:hypothetical protein [Ancylobacter sp. SL191]WAC26267.1 hypothetical protein OU996_14765 [Ancylobacter sp. SL191]